MKLNSAQIEQTLHQIEAEAIPVDHPILPQLEAYQWSIAAPALATDGAKWGVASDLDAQAVARGKAVFEGQAKCSSCHSGSSFTDVDTFGQHPPSGFTPCFW